MIVTIGAITFGTAVWLWILRRYDRIEPEDLRYLILVAVVGGVASVFVASLVNEGIRILTGIHADVFENSSAVSAIQLLVFCLLVGFNEEICKAVAAVYTTRRLGNLNEPIDAMIYAMTVGLGFAAVENVLYAARFGNEVLLVRFLWPVPAHMAYAALWGYGLAKARFVYPGINRAWVMAPSVILAGSVHAVANFLLFLQQSITALVSLGALGGLAYLAHVRLNQLVAESPFLEPGECPVCRNMNAPSSLECVYCGEPLQNTEIFVNCPCGKARVLNHARQCPSCNLVFENKDLQALSRSKPSADSGRESVTRL